MASSVIMQGLATPVRLLNKVTKAALLMAGRTVKVLLPDPMRHAGYGRIPATFGGDATADEDDHSVLTRSQWTGEVGRSYVRREMAPALYGRKAAHKFVSLVLLLTWIALAVATQVFQLKNKTDPLNEQYEKIFDFLYLVSNMVGIANVLLLVGKHGHSHEQLVRLMPALHIPEANEGLQLKYKGQPFLLMMAQVTHIVPQAINVSILVTRGMQLDDHGTALIAAAIEDVSSSIIVECVLIIGVVKIAGAIGGEGRWIDRRDIDPNHFSLITLRLVCAIFIAIEAISYVTDSALKTINGAKNTPTTVGSHYNPLANLNGHEPIGSTHHNNTSSLEDPDFNRLVWPEELTLAGKLIILCALTFD